MPRRPSAHSHVEAALLGDVLSPRDHGLSHAGDVLASDVLILIYLDVLDDAVPGVALGLLLVDPLHLRLGLLLVGQSDIFDLFLLLGLPVREPESCLSLLVLLHPLLVDVLLVQFFPHLVLLLLDARYDLLLLLGQIVQLLAADHWSGEALLLLGGSAIVLQGHPHASACERILSGEGIASIGVESVLEFVVGSSSKVESLLGLLLLLLLLLLLIELEDSESVRSPRNFKKGGGHPATP